VTTDRPHIGHQNRWRTRIVRSIVTHPLNIWNSSHTLLSVNPDVRFGLSDCSAPHRRSCVRALGVDD
jgi:hypothetical protein